MNEQFEVKKAECKSCCYFGTWMCAHPTTSLNSEICDDGFGPRDIGIDEDYC